MDVKPPNRTLAAPGEILPPETDAATAPATLRAYKPTGAILPTGAKRTVASPSRRRQATVGAYLASLAATHAPTTIRRQLSAIGKMHRFNDLPWNPAHRTI